MNNLPTNNTFDLNLKKNPNSPKIQYHNEQFANK